MQTVAQEIVQVVWREMSQMNREQAAELAASMQDQQPAILVYLLAAEQTDEGKNESGWLMEQGAAIWLAMSRVGGKLSTITPEQLDEAEQENIRFLERLDEGSEFNYLDAVRSLLANYNQMPLLGCVIENLMGEVGEHPELADENTGLALLRLKTIIDCLDRASPEDAEPASVETNGES